MTGVILAGLALGLLGTRILWVTTRPEPDDKGDTSW